MWINVWFNSIYKEIMIAKITVVYLLNFVTAQLNGEFWWMNDKLDKFREAPPPPPKFENLSEFDTDESAKIIFKDNDLLSISEPMHNEKENVNEDYKKTAQTQVESKRSNDKHKSKSIKFKDDSKIFWPKEDDNYFEYPDRSNLELTQNRNSTEEKPVRRKSQISDDIFVFKFPENISVIWSSDQSDFNKTVTKVNLDKQVKSNRTGNKNTKNDKPVKIVTVIQALPINILQTQAHETEGICTYISKLECDKRGGIVYKNIKIYTHLICCILPLKKEESDSKIHFIGSNKRTRRSNTDGTISAAIKQRNALLKRKYLPEVLLTSKPPTQITDRVVTPDEDYGTDPYWNIKNSDFKKHGQQNSGLQVTTEENNHESDDYEADYAVEIPKPGLVGLYSDHAGSAPNWSFMSGRPTSPYGSGFDNSDDNSGPSFGYGPTLDPRLEDRLIKVTPRPVKKSRPSRQPQIVFSSKEINSYDYETQTITYDADPNFNVLHGFKMLNFKKRKNQYNGNKSQTVITESSEHSASEESVLIASDFDEDDEDDVFDTNQHVMKNCGKAATVDDYESDRNIGEAKSGSHPWLAIVVLTKKPQTILCYATLIHTRAAVTAADCVHGRNCPGEITLLAGVMDLIDERQEGWQKRLASVYVHEDYKAGELANNLAILHWKRPLRLNVNVQPACLSDPHVGDSCRFYGWSGYDQAIRPRSRWQKASVLTPRQCKERLSAKQEDIPSDSFCAAVHTRGTVTGVGAPLICLVGGRHTASGVAIWRDHIVLLAPAQQWTMDTLRHLDLL